MRKYDKVIIGAGLYGLYSALKCGQAGQNVIVLEYDKKPFMRATYINQARVHQGYHYPRSFSTAIKSANYFERFVNDYSDCILFDFDKIYATSTDFSWTNAEQFKKFCDAADIKCEEVPVKKYFKNDKCDGAFLTREYTYDSSLLCKKIMAEIEKYSNITIKYSVKINKIDKDEECYYVYTEDEKYVSGFVLNTTYASVNQINKMAGFEPFKIKYELCEIILCKPNELLHNIGITVMDGPFFSIMPFGKTSYHSLTSVTFTPHVTCHEDFPVFKCQQECHTQSCSFQQLGNCNLCDARPKTSWEYMSKLAKEYLQDTYKFKYDKSLFSMKPILRASEIDDSRPTVIKKLSTKPTFVSVFEP